MQRRDRRAGAERDALLCVEAVEEAGQFLARDARQDARLALDDGHFCALLARRGGDLQPDIAGADDCQPLARPDRVAQRLGIPDVAQHMHAA